MLLKSLFFALLMSGAAADADDEAPTLIPPPLPRLRGTAQRNSSDVNEGTSPDDIIERAVPCPLIYLPVCCGGVTYANACVAGERQCDDGACSTPARSGGYDEHEDQDEPAARAAVSNHSTTIKNPCRSRRVSSDEPKPDPLPTTREVPSPQAGLVKMPQAVYAIWPILLLRTPHGPRMLQVE